jgi:hypothetical protein
MSGEEIDQDSGLPHIDMIATNAMFISQLKRNEK